MRIYNGALYLENQLDSILNQGFKNLRLFFNDDDSKDKTLNILKRNQKNGATKKLS